MSRYGELVDTSKPTPPNSPFLITYDATDFSGNPAAQQIRLLSVLCPFLPDGSAGRQTLCPPDENNADWYCTSAAFCGVATLPLQPTAASQVGAGARAAPCLRVRKGIVPPMCVPGPASCRAILAHPQRANTPTTL